MMILFAEKFGRRREFSGVVKAINSYFEAREAA